MNCSLRILTLTAAGVLVACVSAAPLPDSSAPHGTVYAGIEHHAAQFENALAAAERGEDSAPEGLAALAALRAAGEQCAATVGCDSRRFLGAYAELLERQAARVLGTAIELADAAPIEASGDTVAAASMEVSPLLADLPEARRSINLLEGRDLGKLIELNGPIKAALTEWLTWMRPALLEAYENYQFMRHHMWPEYEQAGLSEALLFGILAKESGGRVHSVSRAGAAGPLQFMPATGQRFGLGRGEDGFDTRYDPRAATRANVRYLNERFGEFNHDMALALAAYNGGEGRMRRLVRETGRQNFWDPAVNSRVPVETRDYVPMVLAAAWLFLHPEDYGLEFPRIDMVPSRLVLARETSINGLTICVGSGGSRSGWFRTLRNLNPRYQTTQVLPAGTMLEVPASIVPLYRERCVDGPYAALAVSLTGAAKAHPTQVVGSSSLMGTSSVRTYTVRAGDSMDSIARRHRCGSAEALARANSIAAPRFLIRPGQTLRLQGCSA